MSLPHLSRVIGMMLTLLVGMGERARADDAIYFERHGDVLFVRCSELAEVLGYEFKVVQPGRLITFCRDGDEGFCIPVQLDDRNHRGNDNRLMLSADVAGNALRVRITDADGSVEVERLPPAGIADKQSAPAYNADWGRGRGFNQGDTLPDIPLLDMQGNEVRFSQFLGKRYILYCWASW